MPWFHLLHTSPQYLSDEEVLNLNVVACFASLLTPPPPPHNFTNFIRFLVVMAAAVVHSTHLKQFYLQIKRIIVIMRVLCHQQLPFNLPFLIWNSFFSLFFCIHCDFDFRSALARRNRVYRKTSAQCELNISNFQVVLKCVCLKALVFCWKMEQNQHQKQHTEINNDQIGSIPF